MGFCPINRSVNDLELTYSKLRCDPEVIKIGKVKIMSIFAKEWGERTARGDIEQYVKGRKRISENWVIGHLKFVTKFSGVTKGFLFKVMSEIETLPIYSPLQTPERVLRLKNLRKRIERDL